MRRTGQRLDFVGFTNDENLYVTKLPYEIVCLLGNNGSGESTP